MKIMERSGVVVAPPPAKSTNESKTRYNVKFDVKVYQAIIFTGVFSDSLRKRTVFLGQGKLANNTNVELRREND